MDSFIHRRPERLRDTSHLLKESRKFHLPSKEFSGLCWMLGPARFCASCCEEAPWLPEADCEVPESCSEALLWGPLTHGGSESLWRVRAGTGRLLKLFLCLTANAHWVKKYLCEVILIIEWGEILSQPGIETAKLASLYFSPVSKGWSKR